MLAWQLCSTRGRSGADGHQQYLDGAERRNDFLTDTLDLPPSMPDVRQSTSRVRHNLTVKKHWFGKGAFAFFEREADSVWMSDGSVVQYLATALTENQAQQHVVPYRNLSEVGKPVKTLANV